MGGEAEDPLPHMGPSGTHTPQATDQCTSTHARTATVTHDQRRALGLEFLLETNFLETTSQESAPSARGWVARNPLPHHQPEAESTGTNTQSLLNGPHWPLLHS